MTRMPKNTYRKTQDYKDKQRKRRPLSLLSQQNISLRVKRTEML